MVLGILLVSKFLRHEGEFSLQIGLRHRMLFDILANDEVNIVEYDCLLRLIDGEQSLLHHTVVFAAPLVIGHIHAHVPSCRASHDRILGVLTFLADH